MASLYHTNTIIIGAGAAGLACAACLTRCEISFVVLEESFGIGNTWHNRYDRLHLHTTRKHSELPYFPMPKSYPKYVPKDLYAAYLRDYASSFNIRPLFGQKVNGVQRHANVWVTRTDEVIYTSKYVIIATGCAGKPVHDLQNGLRLFKGDVLHSCEYRNGRGYADKKVLVVGFGNSACEIALCLYEHGAVPSLSVRNCVNILPRELAGISVVRIATLQKWLIDISPALADAANAPLLVIINGNIERYGLRKCAYGPLTQITKNRKIPLIDIGTIKLIKRGKITVFPAIENVDGHTVKFIDGREAEFDAVICATGYVPAFAEFLTDYEKVCDDAGMPLSSGQESALHGLYFCGFRVSPTGMLREIGREAKRIARLVSNRAIVN